MIKVSQLDTTSRTLVLSDVVGISKERGDEIAAQADRILEECVNNGLRKGDFINRVFSDIPITTSEEQAFLFICIGQIFQ